MDCMGSGTAPGWQRLVVEPPRPAGVAKNPNAYWFTLATVCIGAFIGQLDASIVTLALPTLQNVFHASVEAVTWVALAYLVALVASVTAVGRLADMIGRKLLYTYGFAVFILGSALCAFAPSLGFLIAFRALQALGAAMLQANSVAIVTLAMPKGKLGRGIGLQGAAQALGLALGPTIGGVLLAAGGWRFIFLVNVPIGILGMVACRLFVPRSRELRRREAFDWSGLALFVPAVFALVLAVSYANTLGWASPGILGLFGACALLSFFFVTRERRCKAPLVDVSLFRRAAFSTGIGSGLLSYLVTFGALFAVPFFLERARHLSAGQAGLVLTAMPLALGVVAPFAGRLSDRLGARPLTTAGMVLSAVALTWMAIVGSGSLWLLVVQLMVLGAALGAFTAPNNASVMSSAPRAQSGEAGGILNMTRGLGTSVGLALTGAVYALVSEGAGAAGSVAAATRGFQACALFLACVALVGAGLSALRGSALRSVSRSAGHARETSKA